MALNQTKRSKLSGSVKDFGQSFNLFDLASISVQKRLIDGKDGRLFVRALYFSTLELLGHLFHL